MPTTTTTPVIQPVSPPEPATFDEDKERAQSELWKKKYKALAGKYEKAIHESSVVEQLVSEITDLAPRSYSPNPSVANLRNTSASTPQSAVLLFSDTHVGLDVSPEQTLGFGEYNFNTFLHRLKYLEESVVSIVTNHTTTPISELVVAMMGDMLDGALNHSAEAGQVHTLFSQYYGAGHAIAQFFRNIAPHFPAVRVHTVVGNHCVDKETEIFTRRGWLTCDQITDSDECVGLLADGRTVAWQPVKQVVTEKQIDRMVMIKNRQFDFRGTEHHRFYYRIPGHPQLHEARWSELDWNVAKTSGIQIPCAGQSSVDENLLVAPDHLIELTAAVLTDGCMSSNRVIVYQRAQKEAWVRAAFEKSGFAFSVYRRTRNRPGEICGVKIKPGKCEETAYALSADSARGFRMTCVAKKETLPAWAWNMTKAQFDRFLGALLDGDGTSTGTNSPTLYGKSKEWLGQVQGLCAFHGVKGILSPYQSAGKTQWRLSLCYASDVTIHEAANVRYTEPTGETVWCVRTESENFLCRRNGRSYFTGNTRWQNQHKMPTNNRFSNLDMFLYALVEALTRDIPNIKWDLNMQPFQLFDVQGFVFKESHGDHLKGGDKALGIPNHAIGREISVTAQLCAKGSRPAPNYYICGHLHRGIQLPHALGEVIINGGFPGLDTYALSANFNPVDPIQRMFFVHPKYGRTAEYMLSLKFAGTGPAPYEIPGGFIQ